MDILWEFPQQDVPTRGIKAFHAQIGSGINDLVEAPAPELIAEAYTNTKICISD